MSGENYRAAGAVTRPGSHTTARTGPYVAVHAAHACRRLLPEEAHESLMVQAPRGTVPTGDAGSGATPAGPGSGRPHAPSARRGSPERGTAPDRDPPPSGAPAPRGAGRSRRAHRPPGVRRVTSTPRPPHIHTAAPGDTGFEDPGPVARDDTPRMRFLFVGSELRLRPPSDNTSR